MVSTAGSFITGTHPVTTIVKNTLMICEINSSDWQINESIYPRARAGLFKNERQVHKPTT